MYNNSNDCACVRAVTLRKRKKKKSWRGNDRGAYITPKVGCTSANCNGLFII